MPNSKGNGEISESRIVESINRTDLVEIRGIRRCARNRGKTDELKIKRKKKKMKKKDDRINRESATFSTREIRKTIDRSERVVRIDRSEMKNRFRRFFRKWCAPTWRKCSNEITVNHGTRGDLSYRRADTETTTINNSMSQIRIVLYSCTTDESRRFAAGQFSGRACTCI